MRFCYILFALFILGVGHLHAFESEEDTPAKQAQMSAGYDNPHLPVIYALLKKHDLESDALMATYLWAPAGPACLQAAVETYQRLSPFQRERLDHVFRELNEPQI